MKLQIKYMISLRCKLMVEQELQKCGLHCTKVELGEAEISEDITLEIRKKLKAALSNLGLELMEDHKNILIERIKKVVIEMIHYGDELPNVNYSNYISQKLGYNYTYLANIFSQVKGIPIRQYIIIHKIEKVKELLSYDELSLKEISYQLLYSSLAHMSNQFKKITGCTPTDYKHLKAKRTVGLENI